MSKIYIFLVFSFIVTSHASAETCGRVTKGSKNAQLIPIHGMVKTKIMKDDLFSCGSMLITRDESIWVELSDLTQFKIAPNSFFEFSKKDSSRHQLYRGELMVSAPPSAHSFELTTPNSISSFHGGMVFLRYSPKNKETTLASFNRKTVIKNKFHTDAEQVVNVGEMTHLQIGDSNILPSQPELMNPHTLKSVFQGLAISSEEMKEMTSVVERAIESRSKSLVADLESWEDIEKETDPSAGRDLASVSDPLKKSASSIDPKEAEFGLALLKKHIYGGEEDQIIFNENRKPASSRSVEKLKDSEFLSKKAKEKVAVKKVLENIKNFDPEND